MCFLHQPRLLVPRAAAATAAPHPLRIASTCQERLLLLPRLSLSVRAPFPRVPRRLLLGALDSGQLTEEVMVRPCGKWTLGEEGAEGGWGDGIEGTPTACPKGGATTYSLFLWVRHWVVCRRHCEQWCREHPCDHVVRCVLSHVLDGGSGSGTVGSMGLEYLELWQVLPVVPPKGCAAHTPSWFTCVTTFTPTAYSLGNCRFYILKNLIFVNISEKGTLFLSFYFFYYK